MAGGAGCILLLSISPHPNSVIVRTDTPLSVTVMTDLHDLSITLLKGGWGSQTQAWLGLRTCKFKPKFCYLLVV